MVEEAIEEAGFRDQFSILHVALVSAKTGYGIEDLITVCGLYRFIATVVQDALCLRFQEIHLRYTNVKLGMRNDIYIVGCTNAGKSYAICSCLPCLFDVFCFSFN